MLKTLYKRRNLIKKGIWLDCPLTNEDRKINIPPLLEGQKNEDFIEWPLPPMTDEQKEYFLALEKIEL